MHTNLTVLEYISSLNFNFSDEDSFAVTPEWVHSTNIDFLEILKKQFPGKINKSEPEGTGYYLNFKN